MECHDQVLVLPPGRRFLDDFAAIGSIGLAIVVTVAACSPESPVSKPRDGGEATPVDAHIDVGSGADVSLGPDISQPESSAGEGDAFDAEAPGLADVVGASDRSTLDVDPRSDAASDASRRDTSVVSDAKAEDAGPPPLIGCPPGPPGTQRPPFVPPPAGCGNETPGRRASLAQQVAKYTTCPSPPVVETAIAPNCPLANPNDMNPDDDALQACLDNGGTVALPAGNPGFILAQGLTITRDGTTLRGGDPNRPALFVAAATLENTMILGSSRSHIIVRFLSLDGNRPARTAFLSKCAGYRLWASGLVVDFARNFALLDNRITRTLCGAALEVDGVDFEVARNVIETNGHGTENRDASEPWADGITLHNCNNGQVHDNLVTDATHVGIVSGGGR